jgi:subtilisin family serine protease
MKIKILSVGFLLIVYCLALNAQTINTKHQTPNSKLNFSLQNLLRESDAKQNASSEIAVFVKGNIDDIKKKTEEVGGVFKYTAGDIAAIRLPLGKVMDVASLPSVSRVENNDLKLIPLNDQAIVHNHVDLVHQGWNLPHGYNGDSVVVGIIDEGIDFTHPDFKNLDGTTRIKYLWDQTVVSMNSSEIPQPYNYGVEWVANQTVDQIDTATREVDADGHGTHVAGIACGNGLATNNYTGMAPKSDIIVVKANLNVNFLNSVADAVNYIFVKADSLHEPAVINISLGTYFGSHDGKDVQSQLIGNLINQHTGRVVVAAAGNAGYAQIHLGYNVNTDASLTWFQTSLSNNVPQPIYFDIWGDTGSFNNVQIAIGLDQVPATSGSNTTYQYLGGTAFRNANMLALQNQNDTIFNSNHQILGIVEHSSQLINGSYEVAFYIIPDSFQTIAGTDTTGYLWRLMTTSQSSARIDAWSYNMVFNGLPGAVAFPPIVYYKKPDSNQNIVSSFQCNDRVITVGSYDNRDHYTNWHIAQTKDTIDLHPGAYTSAITSHGPTRDGRIKPDICAPGAWVLSAGPAAVLAGLKSCCWDKVAADGWHYRNSGTSMASPMVAGICALYLQKNPTASWVQVKNALLSCATEDNFTGYSLPDNFWGYGKANAYTMMTGCTTGIEEYGVSGLELSVYPNPFSEQTTISYDLSSITKFASAEIRIVDVLGKTIKTFSLKEQTDKINLQKEELRNGLYFCTLIIDGKVTRTAKLAVM